MLGVLWPGPLDVGLEEVAIMIGLLVVVGFHMMLSPFFEM